MIIRALDKLNDFTFGQGKSNYLKDQNAVIENIDTRLLSFLNDCFFNRTAGIDWFRLLGSTNTQAEIELSCRAIILQSYGVLKINSISMSVNKSLRIENLIYNVNTIFSTNSIIQTLRNPLNA